MIKKISNQNNYQNITLKNITLCINIQIYNITLKIMNSTTHLNSFAWSNPDHINKIAPKQALPSVTFHNILKHLSCRVSQAPNHQMSPYCLQWCNHRDRKSVV